MLNSIHLHQSEDDRYRAKRIRNFCDGLNNKVVWIESFDKEAVLGLFKFYNFGYNTRYTTPSFGEIFLIDVNSFDRMFLFHEIQSIEIILDPVTLAFFKEREIGHLTQEER
jgi:hypothetical protein